MAFSIDSSRLQNAFGALAQQRNYQAEIARREAERKRIEAEQKRAQRRAQQSSQMGTFGAIAGAAAAMLIPGMGAAFIGPLSGAGAAFGRAAGGGPGVSVQEAIGIGSGFYGAGQQQIQQANNRAMSRGLLDNRIRQLQGIGSQASQQVGAGAYDFVQPPPAAGRVNRSNAAIESLQKFGGGDLSNMNPQTVAAFAAGIGPQAQYTTETIDFGGTPLLIQTGPNGKKTALAQGKVGSPETNAITERKLKDAASRVWGASVAANPDAPVDTHISAVTSNRIPERYIPQATRNAYSKARSEKTFGPALRSATQYVNSADHSLQEKELYLDSMSKAGRLMSRANKDQDVAFRGLIAKVQADGVNASSKMGASFKPEAFESGVLKKARGLFGTNLSDAMQKMFADPNSVLTFDVAVAGGANITEDQWNSMRLKAINGTINHDTQIKGNPAALRDAKAYRAELELLRKDNTDKYVAQLPAVMAGAFKEGQPANFVRGELLKDLNNQGFIDKNAARVELNRVFNDSPYGAGFSGDPSEDIGEIQPVTAADKRAVVEKVEAAEQVEAETLPADIENDLVTRYSNPSARAARRKQIVRLRKKGLKDIRRLVESQRKRNKSDAEIYQAVAKFISKKNYLHPQDIIAYKPTSDLVGAL